MNNSERKAMNKQRGYTIVELIIPLLLVCGLVGWVWNIVKIVQTCCAVIDGMLIVRVIGIFVAPLGAVLGFF